MNSTTPTVGDLWKSGLWLENPGLVKLLGLCPLLAVSNTLINAMALGLATLLTLLVSNTMVSLLRRTLLLAIRIPLYVLIIATTVTLIEVFMRAWLPVLHTSLGIFLPLIVTNCLILGRAESFAARVSIKLAVHDALAMGTGFLVVLAVLGGMREIIGQGSLLSDAPAVFGHVATDWSMHLFPADNGMLLALLPPGAFIALGLLLAAKNLVDQVHQRRSHGKPALKSTTGLQPDGAGPGS